MNLYGHAVPAWAPYAAVAVAGLLALGYLAGRRKRKPAKEGQDRASRGDLLAAAIATAVSAEGMWETFAALDVPTWLRVTTFAFIEVNVIQCGRRARRTMQRKLAEIAAGKTWEKASSGIDGLAMWILTCVSAALSVAHEVTVDHPNVAVVLMRLVAPLVAAWGWWRHMALERDTALGRNLRDAVSGIHWTITPERIAVRLRLAEASERTTPQVDARRRIARVAQAVKKLAVLEAAGAKSRRLERANRRLNRLMAEANEHAGLARDRELQSELKAEIGSLLGAAGLAHLNIPAWWDEEPASDRLMLAVQARRLRAKYGVMTPVNGHRATSSTTPPATPVAPPLALVDDTEAEPHTNQESNQSNQPNHAGQDPLPDLASTVRAAKARGMSERKIAKRFEIKRHRVRALLGQPASTSGDQDPAMSGAGGH